MVARAVPSPANVDVAELRRLLFEEVEQQVVQSKVRPQETKPQEAPRAGGWRQSMSLSNLSISETSSLASPMLSSRDCRGETPRIPAGAGNLDTAGSRRLIRWSTSMADIGAESNARLSPSFRLREAARYHAPVTPRRAEPQHEAPYSAREECRFHREPVLRSPTDAQDAFRDSAGALSARSRRLDTPNGRMEMLGRARGRTPDFHRRYTTNLAGTSLSGMACPAPASPRSVRRTGLRNPQVSPPTPGREAKVACRFHAPPESPSASFRRRAQALSLSSVNVI